MGEAQTHGEGAALLKSAVWVLRREDGVEFRRDARVRFVDARGGEAEGVVIGFALGFRSEEHTLVVRRDGERFHEYAHPSDAHPSTPSTATTPEE